MNSQDMVTREALKIVSEHCGNSVASPSINKFYDIKEALELSIKQVQGFRYKPHGIVVDTLRIRLPIYEQRRESKG